MSAEDRQNGCQDEDQGSQDPHNKAKNGPSQAIFGVSGLSASLDVNQRDQRNNETERGRNHQQAEKPQITGRDGPSRATHGEEEPHPQVVAQGRRRLLQGGLRSRQRWWIHDVNDRIWHLSTGVALPPSSNNPGSLADRSGRDRKLHPTPVESLRPPPPTSCGSPGCRCPGQTPRGRRRLRRRRKPASAG